MTSVLRRERRETFEDLNQRPTQEGSDVKTEAEWNYVAASHRMTKSVSKDSQKLEGGKLLPSNYLRISSLW